MDVKKCDRCGAVYDVKDSKGEYRFRISDLEPNLHIVDLCPKCMQELDNFMGNRRFSPDFLAERKARREERAAYKNLLNQNSNNVNFQEDNSKKYPVQSPRRHYSQKHHTYTPTNNISSPANNVVNTTIKKGGAE